MTNPPPSPYDDAFYAAQIEQSLLGARAYAARLGEVFKPSSVIDFGCGRGTWLKAFGETGAQRLVGLDGAWNEGSLVEPGAEYHAVDLASLTPADVPDGPFDLAMSVEVAEHLPQERSSAFVECLCNAADAVLFGAAIPHQTGTQHVNLRPQSAWAREFDDLGYAAWDLFRPAVWGREDVPYWYQQNTFLYVRRNAGLEAHLAACDVTRIDRFDAMDMVHPRLLQAYAGMPAGPSARRLAKLVLPVALVRRLTR